MYNAFIIGGNLMDVFKLNVNSTKCYEINIDNLEIHTQRNPPWLYLKDGHESWFAVCPGCNNPIQIIGLFSKSINPYGRHFIPQNINYHINGNANVYSMELCPYYSGRKDPSNSTPRASEDPLSQAILSILVEQFDRIIYFIEKMIGFKVSLKLATEMLQSYKTSQGWCSRNATLENIPLVLLNMSPGRTILGRKFINDDLVNDIESALKSHNIHANFNDKNQIMNTSSKYIGLNYCFIVHKQQLVNHILTESIVFSITDVTNQTPKEIYTKAILFDNEYFRNLINSSNNFYRNPQLIDLAKLILL